MLSIKIGNGIAREINSDTTIKVNKGDIIDIKPVDNATFTLTIPEVGDDVILNVTNSDGTQFDLVLQGIQPLFAAGDIITQLMLNINNEEYIVTNTTELLEALDAAAAGGETISQNRSFVDDNANLDPNRSAAEDSDVPHPIDSVELYETNVDGQIIEQYNGVMALTATNTLTEDGGVIIYTVTVNNPPLTDMLVNLNNGLSIEILAGQTVGTASLIINEEDYEDVYIDSDNITASIDTVIGGGYDSLDFTTNGTALTTIVDTIDAVSVSLSSSGDTSEDGGSITYTATLTGAVANNDITVETAQGDITIYAVGTSLPGGGVSDGVTGTLVLPIEKDNDDGSGEDKYNENETISNNIISVTEANAGSTGSLENLGFDGTVVTDNIIDDSDAVSVSLSSSGDTSEDGGSITYTATLTGAVANNDITVETAQGDITIYAVGTSLPGGGVSDGVTGTLVLPIEKDNDDGSGEDKYNENETISNNIISVTEANAGSTGSLENLGFDGTVVTDNIIDDSDAVSVSLSSSGDTSEDGGSITYTATLTGAVANNDITVETAQGDITIYAVGTSLPGGGVSDGVTGTLVLPIEKDNDDGSGEDKYNENETISNNIISVTEANAGSTGSLENLGFDGTVVTDNIIDDSDAVSVSLSSSGDTSEDGGSITYTATLTGAVANNDITVETAQGDITIYAVGTSLPGGGVSDGVTGTLVLPIEKDNDDGSGEDKYNENETISNNIISVTEANAGSTGSLENLGFDGTVVTDNIIDDSDAVSVSLSSSGDTSEDGGSITYTATLTGAVANNDITVETAQGDITIYAVGTSLPGGGVSDGVTGTLVLPIEKDNDDGSGEDKYNENETISNNIISVTEANAGSTGSLENLGFDGTVVTDNIIDDSDAVSVSLSSSGDTSEDGGSITYTATLTGAVANNDITVETAQGDITIYAVGTSLPGGGVSDGVTGTLVLPIEKDNDDGSGEDKYNENETISNNIISVTEANAGSTGSLENLGFDGTVVTDNIIDDSDMSILTISESIDSNGDYIYTATLTAAPYSTSNLVITLDNGETITISNPDTTGISTPSSTKATMASASGGNYENLKVIYAFGESADVQESEIVDVVTGNLLVNDGTNGALFTITEVAGNNTPDANGIITVDTTAGILKVYTQDYDGHVAGYYEYTLDTATPDTYVDSVGSLSDINSVETFNYKIEDSLGNIASSTLLINIEDAHPTIVNAANTIMENETGNSVSGVDLGIDFGADGAGSLLLNPDVNSDGYAINTNNILLTSTIGPTTYNLVYIQGADGVVTAHIWTGNDDPGYPHNLTETSSGVGDVVFTITPDINTGTYTVTLDADTPLDGYDTTTTNIFDSSVSFGGGISDSLLFNISSLYVLATATDNLGNTLGVNYSNANGMGIADGSIINDDEILYLNFTNSSIVDADLYDADTNGDINADSGDPDGIVDIDQNGDGVLDSEDNRIYAQENAKYLSEATINFDRGNTNDSSKWWAYNGTFLVAAGTTSADTGDSLTIVSQVDETTISFGTQTGDAGLWSKSDGVVTFISDTGTGSSSVEISYDLDDGTAVSGTVTLESGDSIDFGTFNEARFTADAGDKYSISGLYATNSEDIEGSTHAINVETSITDSDGDVDTDSFSIVFDNDGVINSGAVLRLEDSDSTTDVWDMAQILEGAKDNGSLLSTGLDEIDLSNGTHILSNLSAEDFISLAGPDNVLKITGDGDGTDPTEGDQIQLDLGVDAWQIDDTPTITEDGYTTYTHASDTSIQLLIDNDMDVIDS